MEKMKKFQVISKEHCPRCTQLKDWLKEKKVDYEEWKISEQAVKDKLLAAPEFSHTFCDLNGCMVYTPVIRLDGTGKYHFKDLFNQVGIREKFVIDLLDL